MVLYHGLPYILANNIIYRIVCGAVAKIHITHVFEGYSAVVITALCISSITAFRISNITNQSEGCGDMGWTG